MHPPDADVGVDPAERVVRGVGLVDRARELVEHLQGHRDGARVGEPDRRHPPGRRPVQQPVAVQVRRGEQPDLVVRVAADHGQPRRPADPVERAGGAVAQRLPGARRQVPGRGDVEIGVDAPAHGQPGAVHGRVLGGRREDR